MKFLIAATVVVALLPASPAFASAELARAKNCTACHTLDRRLVGPPFNDVATRYAGQAGAVSYLEARIRSGSGGAWGQVPMPPNPQVNEAEARMLAEWVLSLSPGHEPDPVTPVQCQTARVFDAYEDRVADAYIAYYGRPADPGGLAWWANRLALSNGHLGSIIDSFGNSAEFIERFGTLSQRALIRNLYLQLYGRDPDPGGWDFYQQRLASGALSLAQIALNILDGTAGGDLTILANRKTVARHYVARMEALGAAAPNITDGDRLATLLAGVDASDTARRNACQQADALIAGE